MIYQLKSRHSTVVEESMRGIGEPVRGVTPRGGAKLRAISMKYIKKTVAKSLAYHNKVMGLFQPAYEKLYNDLWGMVNVTPKSFHVELLPEIERHKFNCGCGDCGTSKAITEGEADRIRKRFREMFGAKLDDSITTESKQFLLQLMNTGRVDPKKSNALFQDMYFETVIAAYDDAYAAGLEQWKKQPEKWREENPFKGKKTSVFQRDDQFIKDMYMRGYKLTTHAVTLENLSGIREIMNNSLMKGLNWQQTSALLNSRFGTVVDEESGLVRGGGVSHWQRLVRTEMATAIDKSHHERYKGMGIEYVRISVSPTACPICTWYADQNDGYYPMDEAPDITEDTHPNCRCVFIPMFNLPRGVEDNNVMIDFPSGD